MRKLLVTGGTVFVSRYVANWFAQKGDEVFVLNRNSKPQLTKPYWEYIDQNLPQA